MGSVRAGLSRVTAVLRGDRLSLDHYIDYLYLNSRVIPPLLPHRMAEAIIGEIGVDMAQRRAAPTSPCATTPASTPGRTGRLRPSTTLVCVSTTTDQGCTASPT